MKEKYNQALVLYHIKEREYVMCDIVANCVRELDFADDIQIISVSDFIINLYNYHPSLIVGPLPRDEYSSQLITMAKFIFDCLYICIPTEQFMDLSEDYMRLIAGYNEQPINLVDYCLFWGPAVQRNLGGQLLKMGKISSEDRLLTIGNLLYERERVKEYYEETETVRLIRDKQKSYDKTIMVVTGRMAVDPPIKDLVREYEIKTDDKEANRLLQTYLEQLHYYNDAYFDAIKALAESFPNMLIIVKRHPTEDLYIPEGSESLSRFHRIEGYDNIVFVRERKQISQYFEGVSAFIHYGSTSSAEASVYGIPTIMLENDRLTRESVREFGAVVGLADYKIKVSDKEGLVEYVRSGTWRMNSSESDEIVYDMMNYKRGESYSPSERLKNCLLMMKPVQVLSYKDPIVRRMLRKKDATYRRRMYIKEAGSAILRRHDFSVLIRVLKVFALYTEHKFR